MDIKEKRRIIAYQYKIKHGLIKNPGKFGGLRIPVDMADVGADEVSEYLRSNKKSDGRATKR